MSKNPAWKTYNDAVRIAQEAYDDGLPAKRRQLALDLDAIGLKFYPKIKKLQLEMTQEGDAVKFVFAEDVKAREDKRAAAIHSAKQILNVELAAKKASAIGAAA